MRRHRPAAAPARPRAARSFGRQLGAALAVLAIAGCASTRITSTWRDPSADPVVFTKLVGVVLSPDQTLRRAGEDAFVQDLGPALAQPGYRVLAEIDLRDTERVRAQVERDGFDGVVVFRLAADETRTRWVPPTYYGTAWGYWGRAAPMVYEPGYLATDRIVQVEAAAYRVSDAQLVWAARSETLNPSDAVKTADEIVRAFTEAMRKDGFVAAR